VTQGGVLSKRCGLSFPEVSMDTYSIYLHLCICNYIYLHTSRYLYLYMYLYLYLSIYLSIYLCLYIYKCHTGRSPLQTLRAFVSRGIYRTIFHLSLSVSLYISVAISSLSITLLLRNQQSNRDARRSPLQALRAFLSRGIYGYIFHLSPSLYL